MATVRYIVNDVDAAIAFYCQQLGFHEATADSLRQAGVHFRSSLITGVGGKQVIVDDPSGNPVELFQPLLPEAHDSAAGD